jgi:beta-galactosidase
MDTYDLVIAPMLHLVTASVAKDLQRFVEGGGHLVTTYFSGIVDENDRVWLGGYPGALRDLLGIRIEEFGPLLDEESVRLDNDAVGTQWSDDIDVVDPAVEVIARYRTGERTGRPAITRRRIGAGSATYVSTRLDPPGLRRILDDTRATVGVTSELPPAARGLVELVIRRDDSAQYWFLINRTDIDVQVTDVEGELLIGARATQDTATPILLAPRGVAVLRRVIG